MNITGRMAAAACIPLALCLCTVPPGRVPAIGNVPPVVGDDFFRVVPFTGTGSVLFVVNGEKQSAVFDARCGSGADFSATMYSSIGTVVGSVAISSDSGTVRMQDREFRLPLDAPLRALGFAWADAVTLRALFVSFCGKVAYPFKSPVLEEVHPASSRNRREYRAQNKHIGHSVLFDGNLKRIRRITVSLNPGDASGGNPVTIQYEKISGGIARYITIKADDLNYFSIRYDNVTTGP